MSQMRGKRSSGTDTGKKREFSLFFKVILPPTLEDNEMGFPPKFVRIYGHELSDSASLTLPDGQVWHLGVTKRKKEIVLDKWLRNFVKHYSITYGHFLVFKYKGMSCFDVNICDTTCCEIQYPEYDEESHNEEQHRGEEKPSHGNTSKKELVVEDGEEETVYSKKHGPRPVEVIDLEAASGSRTKKLSKNGVHVFEDVKRMSSEHLKDKEVITSRKFNYTFGKASHNTQMACQTAMDSISGASFLLIVKWYNIESSFLDIPAEFVQKHLTEVTFAEYVKVVDSGNKEWSFEVQQHGARLRLKCGFDQFFKDKDLKDGDVCLFKLIKSNELRLRVSVFRS
ncbi:hypothetical protein Tsubulata_011091 [Turnera subulata]|uniref:TF-B3 domain-containing protein n=1 Tax=Turnera subulata TaxID=218843 RepID=A0A9Q0F9J2_9ROSI|nr:hypothetical protein Tsubulata_011091 [Turnera subulata]